MGKYTRIGLALILILTLYISVLRQQPPIEAKKSMVAPPPKVKVGIDNIDKYKSLFEGKRVGLITNATGVNANLQSSIDVLKEKTNLVALYAPEHGVRGNVVAGAAVDTYIDAKTGLPVYSLYGAAKKPTAEMLRDVDVLVFDIQDVGARFYTYIYTMAYAMQSCSELGKTFVVLDRPNPVGGEIVEGNVLKPGFESFIGMYPIPIRHGLTVGELARLFNEQFGIGCKLVVVEMTGWKRDMFFDQTGLPWVMTSPNVPTPDTALVYSGIGMFGGTNLSEGVGTTRPFEFVGAPWIDAAELADRMNRLQLPGVIFRPAYFTPQFSKQKGNLCGGVQIHVTNRKEFRAVKTGVQLLEQIKEMSGENFQFALSGEKIDLAVGDDTLRKGTYPPAELLQRWDQDAQAFKKMSQKYYLYK